MPAPHTEKEVRGFLGRLNYIARFISHLTSTCEPIFKLLKKDQVVKWNDDCQVAFDKIKEFFVGTSYLDATRRRKAVNHVSDCPGEFNGVRIGPT